MAATTKTAVTRTVTLSDLTPEERASIFAQMFAHEQAAFFDALKAESADWPGTGWCGQALAIVGELKPDGVFVLERLADHLTERTRRHGR